MSDKSEGNTRSRAACRLPQCAAQDQGEVVGSGGPRGGLDEGAYECSAYREARLQKSSLIEQFGQCAIGRIVRLSLKLVLDLLYERMARVDLQNAFALHVGLPLSIP